LKNGERTAIDLLLTSNDLRKRYQHINLPPELQEFWKNFLAATEVEGTLFDLITCYRMYGQFFMRSKSSLTGKRVKKDKCFLRTMHNASVMGLAAKYVTPIYNNLSEDWRCQDLQRKLVGIAVKLLHQGKTKKEVVQAVQVALEQLGYRTEWPVWELPPELEKWVEEERAESGVLSTEAGRAERDTVHTNTENAEQMWVNEKGELVFVGRTSHVSLLLNFDITFIICECIHWGSEVARAP